jgi:hypothetical protein
MTKIAGAPWTSPKPRIGFSPEDISVSAISNSSTVLDREVEHEKGCDPSGPCIRCPLCGWSPRNEDKCSVQVKLSCGLIRANLEATFGPRQAQMELTTVPSIS